MNIVCYKIVSPVYCNIVACVCSDLYDKFISGEINASAHRHDLGNHSKYFNQSVNHSQFLLGPVKKVG